MVKIKQWRIETPITKQSIIELLKLNFYNFNDIRLHLCKLNSMPIAALPPFTLKICDTTSCILIVIISLIAQAINIAYENLLAAFSSMENYDSFKIITREANIEHN